jgi:hypothetical protein
VAARSKAWVCGRSLAGIAGSDPAGGHGCLSLVSVVCCQIEVSATGRSLVQMSPTEFGVSECDREASILKRAWPTKGCCAMGGKKSSRSRATNCYGPKSAVCRWGVSMLGTHTYV